MKRSGRTTAQDALVFAVIALVAIVLVEGVILSGASPLSQTVTSLSTTTVTDPVQGPASTSTVTVTSDATLTSTSVSDQTSTLTSTETSTSTSTSLQVENFTSTSTSTVTSTDTETATVTTGSTTTSTTTVTSIVDGPFVSIIPGASNDTSSPGFAPDAIVVVIGVNNTVTWINEDSSHQTVTSTSASEPFNSGDLAPHQTFTFTFTKPGTYTYVSAYYHWMSGKIVVK